ncbi:uncharacterized protein MKK02DRAFT_43588 [Dioszegia hungarica]|uniref:Uncharacterized protein n=1 Tax=Dioszegia hungarica TaxID=4972 RepID=A0AA38HEW8_9TREE|nr:uncharacterized protein MKK02DRAFT_43588 [Dioszegia hungarica]KAI9637661.1 hypothetical protein MKK02DRAFT_43588 [Dioszegia hungarica]
MSGAPRLLHRAAGKVSALPQHAPSQPTVQRPSHPASWAPPLRPAKIHFVRLDYETGITAVRKTRTPIYRSPFLSLRAVAADKVPTTPHPFPVGAVAAAGATKTVIRFGVVTSKKAISIYAVERNKARSRFKGIIADIMATQEGAKLVTPAKAYLAVLDGKICYAPREEVERDVLKGMKFLAEQTFFSKSPKPRISASGPSRPPSSAFGRKDHSRPR